MRISFAVLVLLLAVSCGGDPDAVPKYIAHLEAINSILKSNMDKPDECVQKIQDYMAKNGAEIRRLSAQLKDATMSEDEQMKFISRTFPLKMDMTALVVQFREKHGAKADEIEEAINTD